MANCHDPSFAGCANLYLLHEMSESRAVYSHPVKYRIARRIAPGDIIQLLSHGCPVPPETAGQYPCQPL